MGALPEGIAELLRRELTVVKLSVDAAVHGEALVLPVPALSPAAAFEADLVVATAAPDATASRARFRMLSGIRAFVDHPVSANVSSANNVRTGNPGSAIR